jgi:hypothetical protein
MKLIRLNDSVINWDNVCVVYADPQIEGRMLVLFVNGLIHHFDGDDGSRLWKLVSDEKLWSDDENFP